MAFAIKAEFPLGFYQGKNSAGEREDFPTPLRLFSALAAGAYSLERQEGRRETDGLADDDRKLFAWLEENPPDAMSLPESLPSTSPAIAFRNLGEIDKKRDKGKAERPASLRSFMADPLLWLWDTGPGDEVAGRLEQVACEVPYLGEAECPVILTVRACDVPDGVFRKCAPSFDAEGFPCAAPGRSEELQKSYLNQRGSSSKKSAKRKEKTKAKELEEHYSVPSERRGIAYYRPEDKASGTPKAPWVRGYVFDVDGQALSPETWTAWATCMHRAIAKNVGDDLPKVMQHARRGMYPLPNGLAIQVIPADLPVREEYRHARGSIVVMMPAGVSGVDEDAVIRALARIDSLYSGRLGHVGVTFTGEHLDLTKFWQPAASGCQRLFEPCPLFIANSRPPSRRKANESRWTVDDDGRVAVGYVWRDRFGDCGAGDAARVELARRVSEAGVSVCGGRVVATHDVRDYVHRTNKGAMLVGARALFSLSSLGCDECLAAIGQSRHLGGGLLVPLDIPAPVGPQGGEGRHD